MQSHNHFFDEGAEVITLCPGYLRLRSPRLYQSEAEKQLIEESLSAEPAIGEVHASTLTGKVLILFDTTVAPGDMLRRLGIRPALSQGCVEPVKHHEAPSTHNGGVSTEGGQAEIFHAREEPTWHLLPTRKWLRTSAPTYGGV